MDLEISTGTNDLVLTTGDPAILTGIAEVAQQVEHRLKTFRGEWFLDLSIGPNYRVDVFKKNPPMDLVRAILVAEITIAIDSRAILTKLETALVSITRVLEVSFSLNEIGAEEETTTIIFIG